MVNLMEQRDQLIKQRNDLFAQANQQLAYLNGQIDLLNLLLAQSAPAGDSQLEEATHLVEH